MNSPENDPQMGPNVAACRYLRSTPEKTVENSKSTYKIRIIFKKLLIISINWMGKTLGQRGPGHTPRRTPRNGPKGPHEGKSEESASHHVGPPSG